MSSQRLEQKLAYSQTWAIRWALKCLFAAYESYVFGGILSECGPLCRRLWCVAVYFGLASSLAWGVAHRSVSSWLRKEEHDRTIHPDTSSKVPSSSSDILSIMMPFQKFMSSAASTLCLNPCSCEYNQYRQSVLLSALRVGTMSLPMKMINNVTLANNIGYMKSLFIPLCILVWYIFCSLFTVILLSVVSLSDLYIIFLLYLKLFTVYLHIIHMYITLHCFFCTSGYMLNCIFLSLHSYSKLNLM